MAGYAGMLSVFSGPDFRAEVFVRQAVSFGFGLSSVMHFMHDDAGGAQTAIYRTVKERMAD
jgi:hypothetical protein